MGLGKSGRSVAAYLHSQGISFTVNDDCPKHLEHIQKNYPWTLSPHPKPEDIIVVSPGISPAHPILKEHASCNRNIISDIDLFFRFFPSTKAVGITGSVGKTTSCQLIYSALENQGISSICSGNNETPLFSTLQNGQPLSKLYILELSSYQLEWTQYLPLEVAVILNLSEHHLERHGTMDHYRQAKEKILHHAKARYAHTDWINQWGKNLANVKAYNLVEHKNMNNPSQSMLSFMDRPHNHTNRQAAQAVLSALGHRFDHALFQNIQGPEHRQEHVGSWENVIYINDSKATSPHSVRSALACMPQPLFWIAGGVVQKDDLHVLTPEIYNVRKAFLIGQSSHRYATFLTKKNIPFQHSHTLDQAVRTATEQALDTGGTILFSPGCASFDQFDHFVHRGNAFKSIVKKIINS